MLGTPLYTQCPGSVCPSNCSTCQAACATAAVGQALTAVTFAGDCELCTPAQLVLCGRSDQTRVAAAKEITSWTVVLSLMSQTDHSNLQQRTYTINMAGERKSQVNQGLIESLSR